MSAWDREADIVIIGFGYAGAIAAIEAHDGGNRPLILEKRPHFGGISIVSGGAFRVGTEVQGALQYLKRTCLNTTPVDVLRVVARGLCEVPAMVDALGKGRGLKYEVKYGRGTYPFPGGESTGHLKILGLEGFEGYPWLRHQDASLTGQNLFKVLQDHIEERGIEFRLSTAVRRLLTGDRGEVTGVEAEQDVARWRVRARKGVILACGGFEHSESMKLQFLQAQPMYGVCGRGNTGDGIVMAQALGAQLWHMWHVHGSYGFRPPDAPIGFRHRFSGGRDYKGVRKMPWIIVDGSGRRFMNEQPPAPQDSPWREMSYYDTNIQDYPRIPSYLIFDEEGRGTGPMFLPICDDDDYYYGWSNDNQAEIDKGWIAAAADLEELAAKINVPASDLSETVERWNRACASGGDPEFRRPKGSMMPLQSPPFYGVQVWPVISNTQGGVSHNVKQQVIDVHGAPIPRLYAAGEISSVFGHLYLQSANNSECLISGRLAARYAGEEPPWDS